MSIQATAVTERGRLHQAPATAGRLDSAPTIAAGLDRGPCSCLAAVGRAPRGMIEDRVAVA
jgi:hypothetical protein